MALTAKYSTSLHTQMAIHHKPVHKRKPELGHGRRFQEEAGPYEKSENAL